MDNKNIVNKTNIMLDEFMSNLKGTNYETHTEIISLTH